MPRLANLDSEAYASTAPSLCHLRPPILYRARYYLAKREPIVPPLATVKREISSVESVESVDYQFDEDVKPQATPPQDPRQSPLGARLAAVKLEPAPT